jgi:hypothetical protein
MHPTTMQYLRPSTEQLEVMAVVRKVYADALAALEAALPDGRYKSLAVTELEASAMWANKAITRASDGTPLPGATT